MLTHPTCDTTHLKRSGRWLAQAQTSRPPLDPPIMASLNSWKHDRSYLPEGVTLIAKSLLNKFTLGKWNTCCSVVDSEHTHTECLLPYKMQYFIFSATTCAPLRCCVLVLNEVFCCSLKVIKNILLLVQCAPLMPLLTIFTADTDTRATGAYMYVLARWPPSLRYSICACNQYSCQ